MTIPRLLASCLVLACSTGTLRAADDPCEETYLEPATGHPTTLSLLVQEPVPGTSLRRFDDACPAIVSVSGIASAVGIPPKFDFYVVIDRSGSTDGPAGMDVDGDGRIGPADTILAAEVAAARAFVRSIDLSHHRVAVVAFGSYASGFQSLTSDASHLDLALRAVLSAGADGQTNYGAAIEAALIEHGAHGDPSKIQAILFLSDGRPTFTHRLPAGRSSSCAGFTAEACAGIRWAEEAAARNVVVDAFGVGVGTDSSVLAEMARVSGGQTLVIDVPGEVIDVLPRIIHVGIGSVSVTNVTTGRSYATLPGPDGRFSAPVVVEAGLNELTATATSDRHPDWTVSCATDISLTCISIACPDSVLVECDGTGRARVDGLVGRASETGIAVTNDSSFDLDGPGDADASGEYPLGSTTIRFTFADGELGTRQCSTQVTVRDSRAPELSSVPTDGRYACGAPPRTDPRVADACDASPVLTFDESRVDRGCPSSFDLLRTWTATDASGNVRSASQRIEVRDEEPPRLLGVPVDRRLACTDVVPPPAEVRAIDGCSGDVPVAMAEAREPGACAATFRLVRTWTAADACGHEISASQRIDVVDDAAPIVEADGNDRHCLWPPRHEAVIVQAASFHPRVTDDCSGVASWSIVACLSSQPDDGPGDGGTTGDCAVAPDGQSVLVRAERTGHGGHLHVGRSYDVAVVAVDACGNASAITRIGSIHVPHDEGDRATRCR